MAAKVGGLFVDLEAASAGFSKDMGKARRNLGSNAAKMNRSLGAIQGGFARIKKSIRGMGGLLAGLSFVALTGLAKKSLDAADAIGKAAIASGSSVEALQEYAFAAKLAGGTTDGLQSGVLKFSKNIGELRAGTGTLFTLLKKIDPKLGEDLINSDSTDAALKKIFAALSETTSEADRLALSTAAFGRNFGQVAAVMASEGVPALEATREKARALGLVMSQDLIDGAQEANDKMTVLVDIIGIKLATAFVELAPQIGQIADFLVDGIEVFGKFTSVFFKGLDIMDRGLDTLIDGFERLINIARSAAAAVAGVFTGGGASPRKSPIPAAPGPDVGFRHGGQFKVGGAGGFDSQLVQFKASPGEMVTITPQNDNGGGGPNISIDARFADGGVERRIMRALDRVAGGGLTPAGLDDALARGALG